MKYTLFWRFCMIIGFGTVLLFWAIDWLTNHTEVKMSFISQAHQQELLDYGQTADTILKEKGENALAQWLETLQQKEKTWAAVVHTDIALLANSTMDASFYDRFQMGRSVDWKVHLYFEENPVMEIPFADKNTHFLIRLPERMRPGNWFEFTHVILQIALPFILLCLLSYVLYRHIMEPLRKLENVTVAFSNGNLKVRTNVSLATRRDELTRLAITFDNMAERISQLIDNQRQLLADLSHELRTPLTRIDMAVDFLTQKINPEHAIQRLRYEAATMRTLVEDTLTLVWLSTESPTLKSEDFDLVELVEVICEDARFEYPSKKLKRVLPDSAPITQTSQLALGQAIENILRNGLRYTPENAEVELTLSANHKGYQITIKDSGPGVPENMLDDIFKPFFRVDKARTSPSSLERTKHSTGFGLGLALARRQITAIGGHIQAKNHVDLSGAIAGLQIIISLPS
ncbi:sensor histidine kinase [Alteromonas sp. C1M14]|uniref:sensor histidine kinase n=1 Tax=Alteromonas sp. C1M14 TaxID=2841567 RepID=UPI001C0A2591|nr:sensor histidine kinase [Alteromonas sp. C1M14]MBU2977851.1 histidine kinase sensor domain-containing protein [Alteromonas sp. C1M14]